MRTRVRTSSRVPALIACLLAMGLLWPLRAGAWDVDKRDKVGDVEQICGTCWLVCAANMLGGAGWGTGSTPDARSANIYGDLRAHYPNACQGGVPSVAMEWYLKTHGCTGQSPYYSITYHREGAGFTKDWYEYLLDELERCQFVGVDWFWGPNDAHGHCMTLVAGDRCYNSASVWRDGNTPRRDDECDNSFDSDDEQWHIWGPQTVPVDALAKQVHILCPGKPRWAVEEYDVTWRRDTGLREDPNCRLRDLYDDPRWDPLNATKLLLDNVHIEEYWKELYLQISFTEALDPQTDLRQYVTVGSDYPGAEVDLHGSWHWFRDEDGFLTALAKFVIEPQPDSEWVLIDPWLMPYIEYFDVATYCVPEPTVLALVLLGVVVPIRRRRRAA